MISKKYLQLAGFKLTKGTCYEWITRVCFGYLILDDSMDYWNVGYMTEFGKEIVWLPIKCDCPNDVETLFIMFQKPIIEPYKIKWIPEAYLQLLEISQRVGR